ncbi:MAG: outer membrane protein assembly factor BamE [Rickettsiales bacterium]|nr:outer membrane protein assembly factor BamE [Rickettsiales bacterium]
MRKIFCMAMCLLLASCITKEYKSGVPIREAEMERMQSAATKRQVRDILGSPSSMTFVGPEKWFYFNAEGSIFAFLDPKFQKYQILSVKFNPDDTVAEMKLSDIKDKEFATAEAGTELPSEIKLSFFQELFGNIGRFSAVPENASPQF